MKRTEETNGKGPSWTRDKLTSGGGDAVETASRWRLGPAGQQSSDLPRPFQLDPARFMAGVAGFYSAVLSEPAPDHMLRLINEIRDHEAGR